MMREDRPGSRYLAATFIALGLSLAAGGIAFNLWMLRAQELPSPAAGVIRPESAPPVLRLMLAVLMAVAALATAFIVGSFLIVRIGRLFVSRAARSGLVGAGPGGQAQTSMEPAADFRPDSQPEEFGPA